MNIRPPFDRLEQVDAPEQGRLARARRADQADDLVLVDLEVDAPQNLERAERLVQVVDAQGGAIGAHARRPGLPSPVAARSSTVREPRASGIVITQEHQGHRQERREVEVARPGRSAPCLNASDRDHEAPTSAVSFCSPMKSFSSGGITRRTA